MTDEDFMALNAEVERLNKLHQDSLSDPTLSCEQQAAVTAEFMSKRGELQSEAFRRIAEYKGD